MHSTVTNNHRITFPAAGFYIFGGCIAYMAHATGIRYIRVLLNGVTELATHRSNSVGATPATYVSVSSGYDFDQNDYITLQAYQNSGGDLILLATTSTPVFWAAKVL